MPGPAIVYLSPIGNSVIPFLNANGDPNANGFLSTFLAGTSTPSATYTTSAGTVNNAVSIPLGPDGRVPNEIWLVGGTSYKFVLTDSLGALIPGSTYDNIYGINDPTTFSLLSSLSVSGITVSGSINLTGGQLVFPATQVPSANANTLDDYEEGTWTPGISFGNASVGVTYSVQSGRYTKIGRLVYVDFGITLTSKGSSTTQARITGFPFTSLVTTNCNSPIIYSTLLTNWVIVFAQMESSATTAVLVGETATGVTNNLGLVNTDIANTTSLSGSLAYFTS